MHFQVGYATDVGMKRAQNQDSGRALAESGLFVVADGMGGHKGGETASSMAVDIICETIQSDQIRSRDNPKEAIVNAIQTANAAIFTRSQADQKLQNMGTTATALLFAEVSSGPVLYIGHVGDSRCYFLRQGAIWQLTRDHSLVQEKLRAGMITREQAKTDRWKNVITRSVGFEPPVMVDTYEVHPKPGDVYIICSDGLSGLVEDTDILRIVEEGYFGRQDPGAHAQETAETLIRRANAKGGDDNITAIVIAYSPRET